MKKARERMEMQNKRVQFTPAELILFAIKAELKERPIIIVPLMFFFSILVSAFILRAAEMPADE
jgi:hypothetical protein